MASTKIETVTGTADKLKVALGAALVLAAVAAYYLLGSQGPLLQWAALLGCLVVAVVVFFTSLHGKQLFAFGQDAWREVKKWCGPRAKSHCK